MYVVKGKNIIIAAVLALACVAAAVCIGAMNKGGGQVSASEIKVVIDAGHGGVDGGVTGVKTGVKESELNLAVARKLAKHFNNAGIDTVLTRDSDAGLYGTATGNLKRKDMEARRDIILKEKPTLVISVHMNKYSVSTRRGAQVFFDENSEYGKLLADCVQEVSTPWRRPCGRVPRSRGITTSSIPTRIPPASPNAASCPTQRTRLCSSPPNIRKR